MTRVKSAERTFRLLEVISSHRGGLTFTEIQEILAMPRSSTHSLIKEAIANDYLLYSSSFKKYYMGLSFIKMAAHAIESTDLIEELRLLTESVTADLGSTSHAGILDSNQVMYLAKARGKTDLSLMKNFANHVPAHCTAAGKVLLSQMPKNEISLLFSGELKKMTPNSIDSITRLFEDIEKVKVNGYAVDNQEAMEGAACISLPIRSSNGNILAAFSVTIKAQEFNSAAVEALLESMKKHQAYTESRLVMM